MGRYISEPANGCAKGATYNREISNPKEYLEDEDHGGSPVGCAQGPYREKNGRNDEADGKTGCGYYQQSSTSVAVDRLESGDV